MFDGTVKHQIWYSRKNLKIKSEKAENTHQKTNKTKDASQSRLTNG